MLQVLLVLSLAAAPAPTERRITIQGDARLTMRPNQAVAQLQFTSSHRDSAGARRAIEEKVRKITQACLAAGVEPFNLQIDLGAPSPEVRGNEIVSYTQYATLVMTVTDLTRLDDALSAAHPGGAVTGSVSLQCTEHSLAESRVRTAAALNARERAKSVIEALGGKLGLPATVSDRTPVVEQLMGGSMPALAPDGKIHTGWARRELVFTSQVTVQFDVEAP